MTWFAWRLTRVQLAVALTLTLAVAVTALTAGRADGTLRQWLSVLVIVVPGLCGVFWGAPLVAAELESGSYRLAWTQDTSRTRWLAVRLAVTAAAGMAVTGLLSWLVTWWAGPLDRANLDQFGSFDARDIVPVGYAAFAVTLGALLGALLKRTLPAMTATLLTFTAARLAFRLLARPSLVPPVTRALALNPATTGYGSSGFLPLMPAPSLQPAAPDLPNAWITSLTVADRQGTGLSASELAATCPDIGRPAGGGGGHVQAPPSVVNAMRDCVSRLATTYHEVLTYQPANRYWPLQGRELCVFLAVALLLAGACTWRVWRIE
jgi:hypothetical protein